MTLPDGFSKVTKDSVGKIQVKWIFSVDPSLNASDGFESDASDKSNVVPAGNLVCNDSVSTGGTDSWDLEHSSVYSTVVDFPSSSRRWCWREYGNSMSFRIL